MKNIAIKPEDYTILAVDDIATNIMLLKAVLSRAKYKIVTALGGNEALEKAATELPDLILLDVMLPEMDGIEVWNGRADRKNPQANAMACALAQRAAKPVTAGSDAHLPEEIGNGVVTLEADALTLPAVRAALLRGATAVDGRRGKARYVAESQLTKRRRTHAGAAAYVKWALFAAKCCLQDITWKGETYHVLDR